MIRIPLTKGKFALVDDEDSAWINKFNWYLLTHKNSDLEYAVRSKKINGKTKLFLMHREIMKAPVGVLIDHKNWNGLDNQKQNLRFSTYQMNTANGRKLQKATSVFKGVHWDTGRKKWASAIRFNGINHKLGRFERESEAALAYDRAALKYFGEFARLNFPEVRNAI